MKQISSILLMALIVGLSLSELDFPLKIEAPSLIKRLKNLRKDTFSKPKQQSPLPIKVKKNIVVKCQESLCTAPFSSKTLGKFDQNIQNVNKKTLTKFYNFINSPSFGTLVIEKDQKTQEVGQSKSQCMDKSIFQDVSNVTKNKKMKRQIVAMTDFFENVKHFFEKIDSQEHAYYYRGLVHQYSGVMSRICFEEFE